MTEDRGVSAPDPAPDLLEVTVSRSGGVAGMVRRWTARIPDDGSPAARAARQIAGLTPIERSTDDPQHADRPGSGSSPDHQMGTGRVRARVVPRAQMEDGVCVCSFFFSFSLPFSFPARVGQMHAIKSSGDGDEIPEC